MMTSILARSVVAAGLLLYPSFAGGQTLSPAAVRWSISLPTATSTAEPRPYRLWETTSRIPLSFSLSNDSADELTIDTDVLFRTIKLTMQAEAPIAIVAEWESRITRSRTDGTIPLDRTLVLAPRAGFAGAVSLRREDGEAFDSGTYTVGVSLVESRSALRRPTGLPWDGTLLPETVLSVQVSAPRYRSEIVLMYRTRGTKALADGRNDDAVAAFLSALAAEPDDLEARAGLGDTYMLLRRYREAIGAYERVLPRAAARAHSSVPTMLAFAYVLTNDEPNARRVLQLAGRPAANVDREMDDLRDRARRRR